MPGHATIFILLSRVGYMDYVTPLCSINNQVFGYIVNQNSHLIILLRVLFGFLLPLPVFTRFKTILFSFFFTVTSNDLLCTSPKFGTSSSLLPQLKWFFYHFSLRDTVQTLSLICSLWILSFAVCPHTHHSILISITPTLYSCPFEAHWLPNSIVYIKV